MSIWFNSRPEPGEPSHLQIYQQVIRMEESLQEIQLSIARLRATVEERGRQHDRVEQVLNSHDLSISQIKTQIATMEATNKQSGSLFKDYIYPILVSVLSFGMMAIMGFYVFQARTESQLQRERQSQLR
jgi:hypothetical protein